MRKIFFFLSAIFVLNSCEKDKSGSYRLDYSTKILDGYFIQSIAFDENGDAWIGTFKQGLAHYRNGEITHYNSENTILPDSMIYFDIAIDNQGNPWFGTYGLVKYDGSDFTLYNTENSIIPEDHVRSLEFDSKGNLWFSSSRFRYGGLVKYDGVNWEVFTPDNSDLPVRTINDIAIDKDDNVWLALGEIVDQTYLVRISNDNWDLITASDLGFSPYFLGNITVNSRNEICGSLDYSLSSLYSADRPQVFIYNGEGSTRMKFDPQNLVKFVTVDRDDRLWLGCYGGLAVKMGSEWISDFETFRESSVFAIEQAPDGKVWIGSGDGIYIIEPLTAD